MQIGEHTSEDGPMAMAGFPADLPNRLDMAFASGLLIGLHSVHVTWRGQTALERYFAGEDENWGRPLGRVEHSASTLHDLRSVTKSITSLLYGIALDRGQVPPPQAPLLAAFPDYPDLQADPQRADWTVSHALNMTMGTTWNEDLPYTDPNNSEIAMERADDRYRFILDRPMAHAPGTRWTYSGGASMLIARLIEVGTGKRLDAFVEEVLFAPLGVTQYEWHGGADGVRSAASGLRLTAPDLARIGQMLLENGRWNGEQAVPASWIETISTPQFDASFGRTYSHQWYTSEQRIPADPSIIHPMVFAIGNGGQRLYLLPSLDLVIVTFSGHYNRMDQWINPTMVLNRLVLPALNPG
ncbi:MAG: serine hydrolase domain-containing protein [Cohaesibacteraceae bacterium]